MSQGHIIIYIIMGNYVARALEHFLIDTLIKVPVEQVYFFVNLGIEIAIKISRVHFLYYTHKPSA